MEEGIERVERDGSQEECLCCWQFPVTIDELGGGDVRAGDAEGDDLARDQRPDETLRPDAQESPPETGGESGEGRIVERWSGGGEFSCFGGGLIERLLVDVGGLGRGGGQIRHYRWKPGNE